MKLSDRRSPVERFWSWFAEHRSELTSPDAPELFDELTRRLRKIHPELAWEAGPLPDGTCEFAVSADGIRAVAPTVRAVVEAAPPIPGWTIRAFRQPSSQALVLKIRGRRMSLEDLFFTPHRQQPGQPLDLTLFIREFREEAADDSIQASFLLLDSLLGEEAVMFRLGNIDFAPLEAADGRALAIAELRSLVEIA